MEIEEIKKIVLGKNDVLLVKIGDEVDMQGFAHIREQFKRMFPNNKVVIYVASAIEEIKAIGPDDESYKSS